MGSTGSLSACVSSPGLVLLTIGRPESPGGWGGQGNKWSQFWAGPESGKLSSIQRLLRQVLITLRASGKWSPKWSPTPQYRTKQNNTDQPNCRDNSTQNATEQTKPNRLFAHFKTGALNHSATLPYSSHQTFSLIPIANKVATSTTGAQFGSNT
jgi:hypothetical protein